MKTPITTNTSVPSKATKHVIRAIKPSSTTTMEEVARLAGVARSTVSGVINSRNDCRVSESTRKKILDSMEKLNYTPNWSAISLRKGRTGTLGIIGISANVEVSFLKTMAFEKLARANGFAVLNSYFVCSDSDEENVAIRSLIDRQVDGLLIYSDPSKDHSELRALANSGFPVVTINGHQQLSFQIDDISTDYNYGGMLQGKHIIECGYSTPCFLHQKNLHPTVIRRLNGLNTVLQEDGRYPCLDFAIDFEDHDGSSLDESAVTQIIDFLKQSEMQHHKIDVLIAAGDVLALFALKAAVTAGKKVPQEMGIIGFDNIRASRYSIIGLTTVGQETQEVGNLAFQLLNEKLKGERDSLDYRQILVKPKLVIRESTNFKREHA